jgi:hypothetical protein
MNNKTKLSGPSFIPLSEIFNNVTPFSVDNVKKFLRERDEDEETKRLTTLVANEALEKHRSNWSKGQWALIAFCLIIYMLTTAEYKYLSAGIIVVTTIICYAIAIFRHRRLKRLCEGISLAW